MKLKTITLMSALALATPLALAHGDKPGAHEVYDVGNPGHKKIAKRTIAIAMNETDEGMRFEPKALHFKKGETVILSFTNKGKVDHEFVMDSGPKVVAHKALMEKFPEMEHADPNSLRLKPGAKGQIVWTFSKAGTFTFACLIPGHYDSGMHGPIVVK